MLGLKLIHDSKRGPRYLKITYCYRQEKYIPNIMHSILFCCRQPMVAFIHIHILCYFTRSHESSKNSWQNFNKKHTKIISTFYETYFIILLTVEYIRRSDSWMLTHHMDRLHNKWVSHIRAPLVACHRPAGAHNRPPKVLYVFGHKM